MTEELKPELAPIGEKMTQELVKANVTEAVIASIREKYLPLKISGLEDKETYLLVKEGRKECKSLRVMAKKICTNGREEATAIQKAWIAKEKEVTGRIAEVEDYLEAQEKEYEAGIAAEKEARKRKEEEQLIIRQQILTNMGALYSDGCFVLGDVSFELSAIKESDLDVWNDVINAAFLAEYQKIQAEEIEKARLQQEREAELKRQQEELELKQKELAEKEAALKQEQERQEREAEARWKEKIKTRTDYLSSLGLIAKSDGDYVGHGLGITSVDIEGHDESEWSKLMDQVTAHVELCRQNEAEEKRKEQERIDLQNKRYAELLPFDKFGDPVEMDSLWDLSEDQYMGVYEWKKAAFQKAEEERVAAIKDAAAKKERERIEEEQRQENEKKITALGELRMHVLVGYNAGGDRTVKELGVMSEGSWDTLRAVHQNAYAEVIRKQEEERKAEELAKASDKEKWDEITKDIEALRVLAGSLVMRSGQYRKKRQMLLEKLEEIKAL